MGLPDSAALRKYATASCWLRSTPVAVEQRDRVLDLRVGLVGKRGEREEPYCLVEVFGYAAPLFVESAQRILRLWIAGVGRNAQQLGCAAEILRK